MAEPFTAPELKELRETLADSSRPLHCPRCDAPLERREVPPRPDVSYVRDRIWLLCGSCGGSAVVERSDRKDAG